MCEGVGHEWSSTVAEARSWVGAASRLAEFRLNNNHRALYARMLMSNCDELKGFFLTRERV